MLVAALYPVFFTGTHGRGAILGFVAGLVAIATSSRQRLITWSIYGAAIFGLLLIIAPMTPEPDGAGPPLDPVVQISRVIASDYPDLAVRLLKWRAGGKLTGGYRGEVDNLYGARDTAGWRKAIWRNAIHSLKTTSLQLMGQGEGTSIGDLTPDGQDIHTPHNISIYCIYYTGYLGLAIFFLMLFVMWLAGIHVDDPVLRTLYSATFWCTLMVAITGNFLESPIGAVPFYLWQGVLLGLDQRLTTNAKQARKLRAEMEHQQRARQSRSQDLVPA